MIDVRPLVLTLMTEECWSENGRSARSDFLLLNAAAQGLISNHLKQIGHQMKGTPTVASLISIIRLLTAGRRPTPTSCLSLSSSSSLSCLSSSSSSSSSILTPCNHAARKTDGTSQSPRHPSVSIRGRHISCVRRLCLEVILVTRGLRRLKDGGPWEHRDWTATSELLLFFH